MAASPASAPFHVASLCGTSNLLSLSCRDIGRAFRAKQLIQDHLRSLTNSHLLNHISPIWRKVTFTGSRDQDMDTAPTTGHVSVTELLCPSVPGSDQQRPFCPDLQHRNHWKDTGGCPVSQGHWRGRFRTWHQGRRPKNQPRSRPESTLGRVLPRSRDPQ